MGTPDGMGYIALFAISLPGLIGLFLCALGLLHRKPNLRKIGLALFICFSFPIFVIVLHTIFWNVI